MTKFNTPICEQETTINFYRDCPIAKVYTSDSTTETILDRYCKKYPESYRLIGEDEYGAFYEVDKKLLFRSPRKVSDEAKEAFKQRMHGNAENSLIEEGDSEDNEAW